MNTNNTLPAFKEAIGTWEAFRKLGFKASQLYFHMNPDGIMMVVLEAQGVQFAVTVGRVAMGKEEWETEWGKFTLAISDGTVPDSVLEEWYVSSLPYNKASDFLLALHQKGIRIPNVSAKLN